MENLEDRIKAIVENRLMRTQDEVDAFEQAVENLYELEDPSYIRQMFSGFDDETEESGVMYSLVHTIDAYDSKFGLTRCTQEFISGSANMLPHASGWMRILLIRYLNNVEAMNSLKEEIEKTDFSSKKHIIESLKQLTVSDPEFTDRINDLLK